MGDHREAVWDRHDQAQKAFPRGHGQGGEKDGYEMNVQKTHVGCCTTFKSSGAEQRAKCDMK